MRRVEFPPIGHAAENVTARMPGLDPAFRGSVFGYANLAADYLLRPRPAFRQFRGVTPMWDNTARRPQDGMVVHASSPEAFGVWCTHALRQTRRRHAGDERLLFVNAWNEWAEGNHLEPDAAHGRRYLEALAAARALAGAPDPPRPSFDDARARDPAGAGADGALDVARFGAARERGPDDGVGRDARLTTTRASCPRRWRRSARRRACPASWSSSTTARPTAAPTSLRDGRATAPMPVVLVRQANAGAHVALNRGMALARGDRSRSPTPTTATPPRASRA